MYSSSTRLLRVLHCVYRLYTLCLCLQALYIVFSHHDNVFCFPTFSAFQYYLYHSSPCFRHNASVLFSQQSISSVSEVHHLPIPVLSSVNCVLGKVQRITSQSMPLINHISCRSATEVQEHGRGQTLECLVNY